MSIADNVVFDEHHEEGNLTVVGTLECRCAQVIPESHRVVGGGMLSDQVKEEIKQNITRSIMDEVGLTSDVIRQLWEIRRYLGGIDRSAEMGNRFAKIIIALDGGAPLRPTERPTNNESP